ncbi:MAG: GNAT family N-acetyltransferase, partial [Puniceicoccales bacterium]|nr:GNAT family N-acetyltransferase [Puniceicoccales bacterium]
KTYFEIRNNQNGDLEHIKFYEDGKRKTEGECKITYDRRCNNMGRDMGLNLLIVTKIPGRKEYVSPAWIVISRLKNFPKVAEIAYIKSGEWKYRDGLVSKALGKVVSAISKLTARNVYDIECIYATAHPENIKSINLLLRNGFYADDSLVVEMADGPRKIFYKKINGNNLRN